MASTGTDRSEELVHQSHGLQAGSDVEVDMTSDDDDGSVSESSKGQIKDIMYNDCEY